MRHHVATHGKTCALKTACGKMCGICLTSALCGPQVPCEKDCRIWDFVKSCRRKNAVISRAKNGIKEEGSLWPTLKRNVRPDHVWKPVIGPWGNVRDPLPANVASFLIGIRSMQHRFSQEPNIYNHASALFYPETWLKRVKSTL